MHGMLEHRLAAVILDDDRDCTLQRSCRIHRIRYTALLEVIDDVDGILDDLAVGCLQYRDDPPTDLRQNARSEVGMGGGTLDVGNALIAQITAGLAGIKGVRRTVKDVGCVIDGHARLP